ncbi:MAG TPA: hypothetical protein VGK46_03450 [Saprospiraceae bacterium]
MKEEFDDILKRKWEEQHFPVDESHREEMIALLNGKKRRKMIPIWWLGGLGMAAIIAGYFLTIQGGSRTAALDKTVTENHEVQTSGEANQQSDVLNTENIQEPSSLQANESSASVTSTVINPSTASSISSLTPSSTTTSASKKSTPVNAKTINKNSSINEKTSSNQKESSTNQIEPITLDGHPSSTSKGIGSTPSDVYQVDEEAARSYQIVSKAAAVTIEPETRYEVNVEDIFLPDFTGIRYSSDDLPAQTKPNTSFKKSIFLFGETGVGMIFASKPDFTSGWKFRGGAGVGYKMTPKVQVSLSLGYLLQAGGFDFQRSSTVNHAGFGTRSSFNTLTPDKLHHVYSRVGVQYRINRHIFGAHGGVQYLYGSQGELVTQVNDQFTSSATETSEYTWLVTDGLRRLNWTADVSYGYQLTPRLFASAGADFYFAPITIEDAALAQDGYYWKGAYAPVHPFITLNYLIYAGH